MKQTIYILLTVALLQACANKNNTTVSISGDKWLVNGQVINKNAQAEGLLMNVRMVNSVFEDRGEAMPAEFKDFDSDENTAGFISKIPEYFSLGVNAFTISLQGGLPGYEGAVNTAFNANGSLRPTYLERVERVISNVNKNGGVIILTCFYQRQHSHESALKDKVAILTAAKNTANWIKEKEFTNVVLEISNEYWHLGFSNWKDGEWIKSTEGQTELIKLCKKANPELLVSTSGLGNGKLDKNICETADFLLIHFNSTPVEEIPSRINALKKWGKPIVCNEDDKTGEEAAKALEYSVQNGAGWGYMNSKQNQYIPFRFEGMQDDPPVYDTFKKLAGR